MIDVLIRRIVILIFFYVLRWMFTLDIEWQQIKEVLSKESIPSEYVFKRYK